MNLTASWIKIFLCINFLNSFSLKLVAQNGDCVFKDTIFTINFGTEDNHAPINLRMLRNYREVNSSCPDDGYYSFVPTTSECFLGDWITLNKDHSGNSNGRMMLVNASPRAGEFFIMNFEGFKPSTTYEFGVWLINVCKLNSGCVPMPPNILITLETSTGKKLAEFKTGTLQQADNPAWKKYFGMFTTPAEPGVFTLRMNNTINGGCGNDFAMDDITFRECYPPPPPAVVTPIPLPEKKDEQKPPKPKEQVKETKLNKKEIAAVNNKPIIDSIVPKLKTIAAIPINLPAPLATRENPIVKRIETGEGEISIELYDNGTIDGDTISVYHNNELVVSHQALSGTAISFKVKVDPAQPRHEIVMVADNLGSIPPNTSLMVVTAANKRYEVFISSTKQKNAMVVIEKKQN